MKLRTSRAIINSSGRLVLMALFILSAVAWRGQIFGIKTDGTSNEKPKAEFSIGICQDFFEHADRVRKVDDQHFQIFDGNNNPIGNATWYKGAHGYGGRVPLFLITDTSDKIIGLHLGHHYETSDHLADVVEDGLFEKWNELSRADVLTAQIDGVSGATLTSQAIISGVQSVATGQEIKADYSLFSVKNLLSLTLLILLTVAYLKPAWIIKFRSFLQLLTVGVFGFWLTHFLSLNQIMAWGSGGINWKAQLVVAVLFVLAVLMPVLFGKNFYCNWACPYGAAQELCGKVTGKKLKISSTLQKPLKYAREVIFFAILFILWIGFLFDVSLIEPFAAFSISSAGYFTMALAGLFLILSLFVPKAWCRYFCPTGYLLDWIRK